MKEDILEALIADLEQLLQRHLALVADIRRAAPALAELSVQVEQIKEQQDALETELVRNRFIEDLERLHTDPQLNCDHLAKTHRALEELGQEWHDAVKRALADSRQFRNRLTAMLSASLDDAGRASGQLALFLEETIARAVERHKNEEVSREKTSDASSFEFAPPDEVEEEELEGLNRRGSQRDDITLDVRVRAPNTEVLGVSENVSSGGIFVITPEQIELGTMVHVWCTFPDATQIQADGLVVWQRGSDSGLPPGIGLEFVALSEEDQTSLQEQLVRPA